MQLRTHQTGVRTAIRAAPARSTLKVRASADKKHERAESKLLSISPVAVIAAAEGIRQMLQGPADYFSTLGLPEALVHWGHPGNMFVVLAAMGGYGAYQGWQIRLSDDTEVIAKAKDSHAGLMVGMFVFFALGATGGMMSLVMQGKPIFESSHVTTGLIGLSLLSFQAMLPLFFAESPGTRTVHAYLGSATMALFVVHAALGLQLGLSF